MWMQLLDAMLVWRQSQVYASVLVAAPPHVVRRGSVAALQEMLALVEYAFPTRSVWPAAGPANAAVQTVRATHLEKLASAMSALQDLCLNLLPVQRRRHGLHRKDRHHGHLLHRLDNVHCSRFLCVTQLLLRIQE